MHPFGDGSELNSQLRYEIEPHKCGQQEDPDQIENNTVLEHV